MIGKCRYTCTLRALVVQICTMSSSAGLYTNTLRPLLCACACWLTLGHLSVAMRAGLAQLAPSHRSFRADTVSHDLVSRCEKKWFTTDLDHFSRARILRATMPNHEQLLRVHANRHMTGSQYATNPAVTRVRKRCLCRILPGKRLCTHRHPRLQQ